MAPHAVAGTPFALAWRNYIKSVLQKGFMYRLSPAPESLIFVPENKTLGGREDRTHHGEASGRKVVVSFFKQDAGGLVHRVDRDDSIVRLQLRSIAELLQTLGMVLPPDPERSAAETELLLERHYLHFNISGILALWWLKLMRCIVTGSQRTRTQKRPCSSSPFQRHPPT